LLYPIIACRSCKQKQLTVNKTVQLHQRWILNQAGKMLSVPCSIDRNRPTPLNSTAVGFSFPVASSKAESVQKGPDTPPENMSEPLDVLKTAGKLEFVFESVFKGSESLSCVGFGSNVVLITFASM